MHKILREKFNENRSVAESYRYPKNFLGAPFLMEIERDLLGGQQCGSPDLGYVHKEIFRSFLSIVQRDEGIQRIENPL